MKVSMSIPAEAFAKPPVCGKCGTPLHEVSPGYAQLACGCGSPQIRAGMLIDTPGVLDMLVRTARALTEDEPQVVWAVMIGSGGTANPDAVREMLTSKP